MAEPIKQKSFPLYVRIFNREWYLVQLKDAVKRVACRVLPVNLSKQTLRAGITVITGIILSDPQGVSLPYDALQECYGDISAQVDACFPDYLEISDVPDAKEWRNENLLKLCGFDISRAESMARAGADSDAILKHFYNGQVKRVKVCDECPTVGFGARGDIVRAVQNKLNRISRFYPCIGKLKPDGIFGQSTENAVKEFQRIKGIRADGIVGNCTHIELYYAFDKVSTLLHFAKNRENLNLEAVPVPMSQGKDVDTLKRVLALFGEFYPELAYYANAALSEDGYGHMTAECISRFQGVTNTLKSGVISGTDMYNIINTYLYILSLLPDSSQAVMEYPGYELYENCVDQAVQTAGEYLCAISEVFDIPRLTPSDLFTPRMHNAVVQFQLLFMPERSDGVIDHQTWDRISQIYLDVKAAEI